MKIAKSVMALIVMLSVLSLLGAAAGGVPAAAAQGANLIYNGSFEGTYVTIGIYENMRVASGWMGWWREESLDRILRGYGLRPEFKASFSDEAPFNRTHSGTQAQQYFHSFGTFEGGVWQAVHNVQRGQLLRFSMWGMQWSCDDYERCHQQNPPRVWSWRPSDMHMRIGIDPFGGDDPLSPNIVWSPEMNSYDQWSQYSVEAVAAGSTVSVWTYGKPEYRSQDNDFYLDDAEMYVVGTGTPPVAGAPAAPPAGTVTATPAPLPGPVGTPGPGEQSYTVVSGDTLGGIGLRLGVSWQLIAQRNSLANPDYIYVGQVLIIPAP